MAQQQIDHHFVNAQAAEAAQWMADEMQRNKGTLTQDAAWKGVRERFGETFARDGETGNWFTKPILIAFRKLTPDAIWDPAGNRWHQRASNKTADPRRMS